MKPLSKRQLDALRNIAKGMPHKEAASVMGVSVDTFKAYTRDIRYKLNADTMAEATFKAAKAGIL